RGPQPRARLRRPLQPGAVRRPAHPGGPLRARGRPSPMTDMDPRLDGRRALVTGAGQGVGSGVAHQLADVGVHVLVNDRDRERADAVTASINESGGTASAAVFDVTDHAAVVDALAVLGPVDILVNNAGNAGADGF